MITSIFIFKTGNVAVFDNKDKQITNLQRGWFEQKQILSYLIGKYPHIHVIGGQNMDQTKLEFLEWTFWFPYLMHFLELR